MSRRFWITLIAVLALDQWTKALVATNFAPDESRIAIPHLLWWTYVQNRHGAFGLFGSSPFVLVGMALVVLVAFYLAFRDAMRTSDVVTVAFAAIVGGAVGNVIDRFRHGFVVDFIDLRWWPVFNVADSCITIGVVLLVLTSLRGDRTSARRSSAAR